MQLRNLRTWLACRPKTAPSHQRNLAWWRRVSRRTFNPQNRGGVVPDGSCGENCEAALHAFYPVFIVLTILSIFTVFNHATCGGGRHRGGGGDRGRKCRGGRGACPGGSGASADVDTPPSSAGSAQTASRTPAHSTPAFRDCSFMLDNPHNPTC